MFKVPILLIISDKIEEMHNVFQILRAVQPHQIYVAGDAPRSDDMLDKMHTYQTRSVIQPEWPCQVVTNWQETHQGKSKMVEKAMKWFFEHEDEGIILFEDKQPSYDFFPYCEELLNRYRNNEQVYSIGGTYLRHRSRKRHKKRLYKGGSSYFFSAYASPWGFATWKNRWLDFSISMDTYDLEDFQKIVNPYIKKSNQRIYWITRFNMLKRRGISYWDYQCNLHIWAHNGKCITPYINQITNLSISKESARKIRRLKREAYPILPLVHPSNEERNYKEEKYMFKHIFNRGYSYLFRDWLKKSIPE